MFIRGTHKHILPMSSFSQTVGESDVSIFEQSSKNLRIEILQFDWVNVIFRKKNNKLFRSCNLGVTHAPDEE